MRLHYHIPFFSIEHYIIVVCVVWSCLLMQESQVCVNFSLKDFFKCKICMFYVCVCDDRQKQKRSIPYCLFELLKDHEFFDKWSSKKLLLAYRFSILAFYVVTYSIFSTWTLLVPVADTVEATMNFFFLSFYVVTCLLVLYCVNHNLIMSWHGYSTP